MDVSYILYMYAYVFDLKMICLQLFEKYTFHAFKIIV